MTDKDLIIQQIMDGGLQELYNLLEPIKDENNDLKQAYKTIKYGKNIKYHIEWNLKQFIDIRDRQGIVVINGTSYPIEQWWDEEELRRSTARRALMDYYLENDDPYTGRKE